jgi:hypothetical protein
MGKWAEVKCDCLNRVRLPGGAYEDRPHRGTYPLSESESKDVADWELTKKDMFECGHRNGLIYEFWPGDVILAGNLIAEIFSEAESSYEILIKVGDWRCYEDEVLELSPSDAARWLTEIQRLSNALHDLHGSCGRQVMQLVQRFLRYERDEIAELNQNLEEAREQMSTDAFNSLSQNVQDQGTPDLVSTIQKIMEALDHAERICRASLQTRNPIRMLW